MRAELLVSQTSTHGLRVVACACLITALVGAGSTHDSAPELLVHFPHDGAQAALPLHVRYSASAPCRSALAVDGLLRDQVGAVTARCRAQSSIVRL